jgi:hypothetical protein
MKVKQFFFVIYDGILTLGWYVFGWDRVKDLTNTIL